MLNRTWVNDQQPIVLAKSAGKALGLIQQVWKTSDQLSETTPLSTLRLAIRFLDLESKKWAASV